MKRSRVAEGQGAFEFAPRASEDAADAQWVQEYYEAQARRETGDLTTSELGVQALSSEVGEDDDRYDDYVELGVISPDEARARRKGIRPGRQAYLDMRRELALKATTDLPDGDEKDQKIAEIYRRFPE